MGADISNRLNNIESMTEKVALRAPAVVRITASSSPSA